MPLNRLSQVVDLNAVLRCQQFVLRDDDGDDGDDDDDDDDNDDVGMDDKVTD